MERDTIRRCVFSPYRKGMGPIFHLAVWDTGRTDSRGQSYLGYQLTTHGTTIFQGEDFAGSPLHADDSDETISSLMSFLTLRPGDTDSEHFEGYSTAQLDFASEHAEALSWEVIQRFEDA